MALLPLASFAATYTNVDISAADVVITLQTSNPVYNNQVQTPTITKVVVDGVEYTSELTQFFTPKYYKKNALNNWIPQNADQIQDAGEYAVAIVANGAIDAERELQYTADRESDDEDWAFYTIQKKDLNVTLENGTKQYGGTDPTELDVTPTNLPDGWTAPEFTWTAPLPIEGAHANVNAEGYPYNFPQNTLTGQTYVSSVNYNVFITNQPKLIVTKKQIALNYIGTAAPVKTYGVGNTTATLGLNEDFLTAILNKANYAEPGTSELVGGDVLADVLAGLTAAKVVVSLDWAAPAGVESANAYNDATPIAGGAEHKVKFAIDESVATNYKFTVADVALTVKQAELSAAANAPFTFAKAETAPFTYNAADQTLTKTITYTANNEQLLAEAADPAVTPQVNVTYKYKTLGTAGAATTPAANYKAAGVYEAYVAPVSAEGNFYTEGGDPIRVTALDYTINKKDLYLYVNDDAITETYKGAAYTLPESDDITFQGLIASDATTLTTDIEAVVAQVEETGATTVTAADTYTIVPVVLPTNKLNDNYAVQTYTSTFTVSPLAITIDPKDMPNVVYGTAIASTAAATVDDNTDPLNPVVGNVTVTKDNEDDPAIVAADQAIVLQAYNVVVADQTYAAGQPYTGAITLVKKDLDETADAAIIAMLKNFTITPGTGDVTIGNGTYSIVVKNKNKTYGDELTWSLFDYLTPGLTGTTKPADVKFILVNKADAEETYSQNAGEALPKNVGTYIIKVDAANSNLAIENYTTPTEEAGTLIAGELTIAAKALTFTTSSIKVNTGATKASLNTLGASKVTVNGLAYETDKILFDLVYVENAEGTLNTNKITLVGGPGANADDMSDTTPADTYAAGYKVVEPASVDADVYANANYAITWNVTGELEVVGANVLLLDQQADDLMAVLAVADDGATEYDVTLQNVKFSGNVSTMNPKKWYSMVLPFTVSVAKLSSTLGYAIVNRMDQTTSDGNLHFRLAFDEIPANEPFLVKSVKGAAGHLEDAVDINTVTFTGVKIAKPADVTVSIKTADANPIVFTGVYEKEHYLAAGDKLYNGVASDIPLKVTQDNYSYLNPFRSYWTASVTARIFVEDLNEDGTTAIKEVDAQTMNEIATEGWYTVNGMKLNAAPVEKGIYIHNGKKVVLK